MTQTTKDSAADIVRLCGEADSLMKKALGRTRLAADGEDLLAAAEALHLLQKTGGERPLLKLTAGKALPFFRTRLVRLYDRMPFLPKDLPSEQTEVAELRNVLNVIGSFSGGQIPAAAAVCLAAAKRIAVMEGDDEAESRFFEDEKARLLRLIDEWFAECFEAEEMVRRIEEGDGPAEAVKAMLVRK